MSRIFWDTMLFIYFLEGRGVQRDQVKAVLTRHQERGDTLFTSHLAVGEVMSGARRVGGEEYAKKTPETIKGMRFEFLPFDQDTMAPFSLLRERDRIKPADAMHLACASAAQIDLFVTADERLNRLRVPGIQFIVGIEMALRVMG